jgi:hypothetical protein
VQKCAQICDADGAGYLQLIRLKDKSGEIFSTQKT